MSRRSNADKAVALLLPLPLAPTAAVSMERRLATPNQVLAIVCVGIVLANLDLFIVNVGLPNIARDFSGATFENLSWILNGYAIAYAALLVFFGRLAERYRRDRSFLLGVALFTAASAACAGAHGVVTLVAARLVQAAGAALMTPTSIGLLLATFPPAKRGGAVRTWAAIGGLAAALGPVVGGVLIVASWRWIFLVNVPIGIVALVVAWWKLPAVAGHDVARPDPVAAGLVTVGIGALTLAIVKGNDWGWGSPGVWVSIVASAVCLMLFLRHCLLSVAPFIDPGLFRNRTFAGAALVMGPYSVAFGASLFSIAVWEQTAWHWSALKAGLAIAPGPLLVPVTSLLLAGRLIARFGAAWVVTAGVFFFVASFAWRSIMFGTEPSVLLAVIGMVPTGIGVGLTFPTLMGVSTSALPPSSFATGSGVINMIRQAAIAVGVALFIAVASPTATEAGLDAFRLGWWIMAAITALALVPTFLMIRPGTSVASTS
jgi:EmrB/QacA subfamily drug resistance transporter